MSGVNKVFVLGHLGRDPDVRKTQGGTSVASFSVATSESFTGSDGEKKEKTEWHNVVAWGKLADVVGQYVKKGSQVHVEGRLETRSWEDKDGVKKYKTEIVAQQIQFCGGGKGDGERRERPQERHEPARQEQAQYAAPDESFGGDDDLPF